MPAVSVKQQRFFGYLLSNPKERKARGIKKKVAKDFASTKHEGLPMKKDTQEGVVTLVRKGKKKHDEAVQKKKVKDRKAVPYAALAQSFKPQGTPLSEEEYDRIKDRRLERGGSAPGGDDPSPRSWSGSTKKYDPKAAKKASDKALANVRAAILAQHGPGAIYQPKKEEWEAAALDVATEYFFEEGINEEGVDLIIEEVGLEDFVEYILDPPPEDLSEERAARKASSKAPSYEKVKAKVDAGDAARKKAGKGEYAKTAAAKRNYGDEDNTIHDDEKPAKKPAAKKKAPIKAKAAPKAKPKVVEIKKKVEKSVPKAKAKQPDKKPEKKGIRGALERGIERHKKAVGDAKAAYKKARAKGKVPEKRAKEFGKGFVSGVKGTVKFAGKAKKAVVGEETKLTYHGFVSLQEETPMERIDRISKENVAKQKAASDAKKAKREKSAKEYQKHKKATLAKGGRPVDALDSWHKKKMKEEVELKEAPLVSDRKKDWPKGTIDTDDKKMKLAKDLINLEKQGAPRWTVAQLKKKRNEEVEIEEKFKTQYNKPNKLSQSSKRKSLGRGASIKDGAKKSGYESKKEHRDTEKKLAKYQAKGSYNAHLGEAKVDAGKSPETKEKDRNVRKFGVSHSVVAHGKLRRALHRSNRGDKKIPGDKPWVEKESVSLVHFKKFLDEGGLARAMQKSKETDTAHISADRGSDEKKNREGRASLKSKLKKHKVGYKETVGKYKYDDGSEGKEVSYQLSRPKGMSKRKFGKVTRKLGREHGQESVITKKAGKSAKMHYTDKSGKKSETVGKTKAGKHPKSYGETSSDKVRGGKLPKKTTKGSYHYG